MVVPAGYGWANATSPLHPLASLGYAQFATLPHGRERGLGRAAGFEVREVDDGGCFLFVMVHQVHDGGLFGDDKIRGEA